jgi:hypothetical protein
MKIPSQIVACASWGAISLLLLAQLPFFLLCFYKYPLGIHEWDWIANWRGDIELAGVDGYWAMQRYWYDHWQGRYSSTLILSLTPYWYTLARFQWVFAVHLLLLNGAVYYLLRQWFWSWPARQVALLALSLMALYLFQLTNVYESLYRLTVVVIYQLGVIGTLLLTGLLARAFRTGQMGPARLAAALFLVAFIPGTNEISLACLHLLLAGLFIGRKLLRLPIPGWFAALYAVLLLGTAAALAAPGNYVRLEAYPVLPLGIWPALGLSLGVSLYQWATWLSSSLLLPAAVLWLLWQGRSTSVIPGSPRKLQLALWAALTVLVAPAVLFPFLKTTGGISLPERVVDLLYFVILFTCLGLSAAYTGQGRLSAAAAPSASASEGGGGLRATVFALMACYALAHLFCAGLSLDRSEVLGTRSKLSRIQVQSNIGQAALCLLRGDASRYRDAVRLQFAEAQACPTDTCYLSPLPVQPFAVYDTLYDRRRRQGEPFMGWHFQQRQMLIWYERE